MGKQHRDQVVDNMEQLLKRLQANDDTAIQSLTAQSEDKSPAAVEALRQKSIAALQISIAEADQEDAPDDGIFHSRNPLTGIFQSSLKQSFENGTDQIVPELSAFGEGNALVWIPTGIEAILDHFTPKAPFRIATDASRHTLPEKCKVALLADWGADNDHAKRLADIAFKRDADFCIHLGDIYYSGSKLECEAFLRNWPLKNPDGTPIQGRSFALNGNHEMYAQGVNYFNVVLPAFGQEASYFALGNDNWQFVGLDTAYVPFSITGIGQDVRLQNQAQFLIDSLNTAEARGAKTILLSHNQPVSAHLPEADAAGTLYEDYVQNILGKGVHYNTVLGWFFGHEHRCTIYDDGKTEYFKARLIGNGAIPHHPQTEAAEAVTPNGAHTTPFTDVNRKTLDDGPLAISTFVLMTIDGTTAQIEYINEDETIFFTETWSSNVRNSQTPVPNS